MFEQIIQSWKNLLSKSLLGISAHVRKKVHFSIKICRICQHTKPNNNGAWSTSTYRKGIKHRGSYMSAHVLLNLLNELGKRDQMRGLPSI